MSLKKVFMLAAGLAVGAAFGAIIVDPFLSSPLNLPFIHDPTNLKAKAMIAMVQDNFSWAHEWITGLKGDSGGLLNWGWFKSFTGFDKYLAMVTPPAAAVVQQIAPTGISFDDLNPT